MDNDRIPSFEEIFSFENLLRAWRGFKRRKKIKKDISDFALRLAGNLYDLHSDLISGAYRHGGYIRFSISDPKPRDIHKASVRDRVVHHAIYEALYPYFNRKFIHDSYSCRIGKGTHRAIKRFEYFSLEESINNTATAWVLSGDIRKCFASVDQIALKNILRRHILSVRTLRVLDSVINSFNSVSSGKGLPLGNLTSQLFINIYLNELDQYVKRELKAKKYIRYTDDFVVFSKDKEKLIGYIYGINRFLEKELGLSLHAGKLSIRTVASGVDFLGWVHFPGYRVLRHKTKKRIFVALRKPVSLAALASYRGLLGHGNAFKISQKITGLAK